VCRLCLVYEGRRGEGKVAAQGETISRSMPLGSTHAWLGTRCVDGAARRMALAQTGRSVPSLGSVHQPTTFGFFHDACGPSRRRRGVRTLAQGGVDAWHTGRARAQRGCDDAGALHLVLFHLPKFKNAEP
jgi:hypothetical protein